MYYIDSHNASICKCVRLLWFLDFKIIFNLVHLSKNIVNPQVLQDVIRYFLCQRTTQVDTNLEAPIDIVPEGVPGIKGTYNVAPYSSIILEAKPWVPTSFITDSKQLEGMSRF